VNEPLDRNTASGTRVDHAVRFLILAAGILGAAGVLIGAFGAHGLAGWLEGRGIDPETVARRSDQLEIGVRYHLTHTLVLLALAGSAAKFRPRTVTILGWLFIAGTTLFSGSLYLLVALNLPVLGAVTPLGGVTWIVAWLWLAIAGAKIGRAD
jgi:uncharacterized membrane protein YgdD (TMEM256/DUF423 family)